MSQITNSRASDVASELGELKFLIRSALSGVRTAIPVQVKSVTNDGGVSPIGYVSVQPMVGALDGAGNIWPHEVIENVPYLRIQGGSNAVILDPEVGDIGIASVCDRDITAIKASGEIGGPGSNRKHSLSDIVYLQSIIGAAPTQYVQFTAAGINIVSPNAVNVTAGGDVQVTAAGTATVKATAINLQNAGSALLKLLNSVFATWAEGHVHTYSGGTTSPPTTAPGANAQTSVVSAE